MSSYLNHVLKPAPDLLDMGRLFKNLMQSPFPTSKKKVQHTPINAFLKIKPR